MGTHTSVGKPWGREATQYSEGRHIHVGGEALLPWGRERRHNEARARHARCGTCRDRANPCAARALMHGMHARKPLGTREKPNDAAPTQQPPHPKSSQERCTACTMRTVFCLLYPAPCSPQSRSQPCSHVPAMYLSPVHLAPKRLPSGRVYTEVAATSQRRPTAAQAPCSSPTYLAPWPHADGRPVGGVPRLPQLQHRNKAQAVHKGIVQRVSITRVPLAKRWQARRRGAFHTGFTTTALTRTTNGLGRSDAMHVMREAA